MDRRAARERMRRKRRQIRRRKMIKLATYMVTAVLLVVFVIRGIIFPIANRIGAKNVGESQEVQAQTVENGSSDPNAAVRQPLKNSSNLSKVTSLTPGWHEDDNGRWYQNADGTYYAGGFQEIGGTTYYFDENGYMQTGWVTIGVKDYYFNEDGSYDQTQKRPMIALTFDDGPGQYTEELLDCLEENGAHATFFMLGQNVENYQSTVQRIVNLGCEVGSHSWDHPNLKNLNLDEVKKQFEDTDNALIAACGQAATVARPPYGEWDEDIRATVQKPFFTWSIDSLDWKYKDEQKDYDSVMNADLSDGDIILMHDIHEPTVKAAERIIPDLISMGYKLVTVSEMAEAKGVTLQISTYSDFWQSSFDKGRIAGASDTSTEGTTDSTASDGTGETATDVSDGSETTTDAGDGSETTTDGTVSDGSEETTDSVSDGE